MDNTAFLGGHGIHQRAQTVFLIGGQVFQFTISHIAQGIFDHLTQHQGGALHQLAV